MAVEVSSIMQSYNSIPGRKVKMGGNRAFLLDLFSLIREDYLLQIFYRIPNKFLFVFHCSELGYMPHLAEKGVKKVMSLFQPL